MNENIFPGQVTAFRADNELCVDRDTMVEMTATYGDGSIELAFDVPNTRDRVYLRVKPAAFIGLAIACNPDEE